MKVEDGSIDEKDKIFIQLDKVDLDEEIYQNILIDNNFYFEIHGNLVL